MTLQDEIFSKEQLKKFQEMKLADEFSKVTLEFIFTQGYSQEEINTEIKSFTKDWTKEQSFMFWYSVKANLKKRLQILISSVKYYGHRKEPEDLLENTFKDVTEISGNNDDLLDDRFQNITEKTLRTEIENMIDEDRYEDIAMIQDRVFFRVCAQSLNKFMEDEKRLPQFIGTKYGLEHNLAFFRLLMDYQNKMSGGQELETEVIVKRKGT